VQLDGLARGGFAAAPSGGQIAILEGLDASGSDFFGALLDHTMEGTYSHPVYGANGGYEAWKTFGFAGDVHGVRYPVLDTTWTSSSPWLPTDPSTGHGAWTIYGGYAPDEMNAPGTAATEQPTVTPLRQRPTGEVHASSPQDPP
jgi:Gluconate 2-dehydrogenase subunit 3